RASRPLSGNVKPSSSHALLVINLFVIYTSNRFRESARKAADVWRVSMEPILLYGFPQGSSAGLIAAFEWLGEPYRLCRVDMLRDIKTDEYAHVNGRRETPVLITDGGRPLTETIAIALWLEARDIARRVSFPIGT